MINELYRLTWYDIEIKKENDERNFSTQFTCKDQYCVVALRCCNDQATELVQMQLLSPFSEYILVFQIRIWARNRGGVSGLPMYNIRVQSNTSRVKEYIYICVCVCVRVRVCACVCVCVCQRYEVPSLSGREYPLSWSRICCTSPYLPLQ